MTTILPQVQDIETNNEASFQKKALKLDRTANPLHGGHIFDEKHEEPIIHWYSSASIWAYLVRWTKRFYGWIIISLLLIGFVTTVLYIYLKRPADPSVNNNGIVPEYPTVAPSSAGQQQLIQTTNGAVQGFVIPSQSSIYGAVSVSSWRGIPFAKPPIGNLRWAAPEPATSWASGGALLATEFKPPCVQPLGDPMMTGSEGSEDCLYLNIYTYRSPGTSSRTALLPVLFYIYGGGLMAGWGGQDMTPFLVNGGDLGDGMVIVQVNYRVNLFGFLATSQLSQNSSSGVSGNFGIQDQLLALKWVQANIQAFGGNPQSVTIAGQSSGGTSVFALMSSKESSGLFSAAISLSGSPDISLNLTAAHMQNKNIFSNTSCQSLEANPSKFVACIRGLSVNQIQNLIPQSWNTPGMWGMPISSSKGMNYDSVVIVDGVTVQQPFPVALEVGLINVPLMFGNMGYEPDESPDNIVSGYSNAQWLSFLKTAFVSFDKNYGQKNGTTGAAIYSLYQNESLVNPQKAFDAIVTDYGLTCASASLVNMTNHHHGTPANPANIYIYTNNWGLSHSYVADQSTNYVSRYAHHDVDFWMLTESWNEIGNGTYSPSAADVLGSKYLQNLWYTFMSTNGNLASSALFGQWPKAGACSTSSSATSCSNMFVIQAPSAVSVSTTLQAAAAASLVVVNYKQNICNYFSKIGMNRISYWWSN